LCFKVSCDISWQEILEEHVKEMIYWNPKQHAAQLYTYSASDLMSINK